MTVVNGVKVVAVVTVEEAVEVVVKKTVDVS